MKWFKHFVATYCESIRLISWCTYLIRVHVDSIQQKLQPGLYAFVVVYVYFWENLYITCVRYSKHALHVVHYYSITVHIRLWTAYIIDHETRKYCDLRMWVISATPPERKKRPRWLSAKKRLSKGIFTCHTTKVVKYTTNKTQKAGLFLNKAAGIIIHSMKWWMDLPTGEDQVWLLA